REPRVDLDVHGNAERIRLRLKVSSVAVSETSSRRSVGDAFTAGSACSVKIRAWACEFAIEIAYRFSPGATSASNSGTSSRLCTPAAAAAFVLPKRLPQQAIVSRVAAIAASSSRWRGCALIPAPRRRASSRPSSRPTLGSIVVVAICRREVGVERVLLRRCGCAQGVFEGLHREPTAVLDRHDELHDRLRLAVLAY